MSFEEYVAQQGHALLRLAFVLTGDAELAKDLTQTALIRAYRNWRKVVRAQNPDAYVRRILVNTQLDWARRRSSTEEPHAFDSHQGDIAPDPADGVSQRAYTRELLTRLTPRARTVLVLRYYADLDDVAIADLMGISTGAVRAAASRALAKLRDSRNLLENR
ncbi:MAG TPA: SigE family RNA polymerase sigma factor [Kineosporiaceae bacterium]|nr:SigE family RNA polymerase sigma factor [Kineosporiaceae bacterium]